MELSHLLEDEALMGLLKRALIAASLVLFRLLPLVLLTPLFGGETSPRRFRVGLALFFAGGFLWIALPGLKDLPAPAELPLYLGRELLIGLVLAVFVRILFELIASIGGLIDNSASASSFQVQDPLARISRTPLSLFYQYLALALFFAMGGHQTLILGLAGSYQSAPPAPLFAADLPALRIFSLLPALVSDLFVAAVRLASPVIVTLLLIDLMLALTNRVAQQVQVFFLGMGIKGLLAILLLTFVLPGSFDVLLRETLYRVFSVFSGV